MSDVATAISPRKGNGGGGGGVPISGDESGASTFVLRAPAAVKEQLPEFNDAPERATSHVGYASTVETTACNPVAAATTVDVADGESVAESAPDELVPAKERRAAHRAGQRQQRGTRARTNACNRSAVALLEADTHKVVAEVDKQSINERYYRRRRKGCQKLQPLRSDVQYH